MDTVAAELEPKNKLFRKGDIIALLCGEGVKPNKNIARLDELMPRMTPDELQQVADWIARDALMDPDTDPEWRRQLLSKMEVCPCCQRWLGHNNPPADVGEPDR